MPTPESRLPDRTTCPPSPMPAAAPLLAARALCVGWTVTPIVGPLDLTLQRGEVVGLTGPNGVGKSTLLAALAGSARCLSGVLDKAAGCRLALQTQHTPPVAGLPLNGHELLRLTQACPEGLPAWLADKLDWRLDQLSGGQRQYLALWAILETAAEVILMDEPTNNLDEAGCQHLALAIRNRVQRGAGILLVSHDADFIARTCDRTLNLQRSGPDGTGCLKADCHDA